MLGEERLRQDYHSKATIGETFINLLSQAVAKFNLKLVEPYANSCATQRLGERQCDGLLVFRSMTKVVARLALAEMDSRTPLFRERLWPHLEARPRCSFPQLAVERT